ncbi:DUF4062 domain-containing protein [Streptomonospora alba]|uniref:DUF4062 domain-containing protein n=1 Tax=Streptomonospora alba TaxID=183763 RepID=UPI000A06C46E|nr:DUF4062 domain-containing protein [Streptomonospora alba]
MIVFISSVRRGLEAERDHLPALLRVTGYEPTVFEDFTAQNSPSRDAVVTAARSADVVVLLLGEYYGDPLPDSGVATTEEEFRVAKQQNIPILVFRKSNITPEEKQSEFIRRVGDYVGGRFWKEFNNEAELGVAVVNALKLVEEKSAPLEWMPAATPDQVRWRSERSYFSNMRYGSASPTLEAHLLSSGNNSSLPVSTLENIKNQMVRSAREIGLFLDTAGVRVENDARSAWAFSFPEEDRQSYAFDRVQHGGPSGLAIDRTGSVITFKTLPRDALGTLVNKESLQNELKILLQLAVELAPSGVSYVVPAAGIEPSEFLMEGDPEKLGRTSGSMGISGSAPIRAQPDDAVPRTAFPAAAPEVAGEMASRLIADLRSRNSPYSDFR